MPGPQRRRWLLYSPPLLLVAIALLQLHLAHDRNLTPWKGGGFGMFSTVDIYGYRFVRAYLVTDSAEIPVRVRGSVNRLRGRARLAAAAAAMPTPARVDRLAAALASERWTAESVAGTSPHEAAAAALTGGAAAASPSGAQPGDEMEPRRGPSAPIEFSAVRVEIWRIEYDATESRVYGRKLAEVTRRRG